MSNPRALQAESARYNSSAHDWAETPEAKALIARWLFADDILQTIGGHDLLDTEDALCLQLSDLESELDHCRDVRIADEVGGLSERDAEDDYLIEEIENSAPTVTDVLVNAALAERQAYLDGLAPVTRIGANRVAA